MTFKLINKKGIINLGGKSQSIFDFAKKDNKNLKKTYLKKKNNFGIPFNSTMNLSKLRLILKKG